MNRFDRINSFSLYVESSILASMPMTGIGRFTSQLIRALGKRCEIRALTLKSNNNAGMPEIQKLERQIPKSKLLKKYRDISEFAQEILQGTLYHSNEQEIESSACLFPFYRPGMKIFQKEIDLIYDFTPFICSQTHAKSTLKHFPQIMKYIARHSDRVIAISEQTEFDAKFYSDIPSEKIMTLYPGPSLCVDGHDNLQLVQRSNNIILAVTSIEPRKNGHFLIDWFSNTCALPENLELWIVGSLSWWTNKEFASKIQLLIKKSKRKIKLLGKISDEKLCSLYRYARFTVYPSLYEGFGFPVLDSLLHNCPVITSCNSALQEFEEDGVYFCDPCNKESLDEAALELLAKENNCIDVEKLKKKYNWEHYVDVIVKEIKN